MGFDFANNSVQFNTLIDILENANLLINKAKIDGSANLWCDVV